MTQMFSRRASLTGTNTDQGRFGQCAWPSFVQSMLFGIDVQMRMNRLMLFLMPTIPVKLYRPKSSLVTSWVECLSTDVKQSSGSPISTRKPTVVIGSGLSSCTFPGTTRTKICWVVAKPTKSITLVCIRL